MFVINSKPTSLCDGISRREVLRIGSLGLAGLTLPELIRGAAANDASPRLGRAKSCIVLFLFGGPAQHSTWDPKPLAPLEVRGELKPIKTTVPGLEIGELLPKTSLLAEHLCLLRAMRTGDNAHSSSGYYMLTGQPHAPMNAENANPGAPNNWPSFAAMMRRLRNDSASLPSAVRLPHRIFNTDGSVWPGQDAGFMGRSLDPWMFRCEPASEDFRIPEFSLPTDLPLSRLESRHSLLSAMNQHRAAVEYGGILGPYDAATRQAFDLLTSARSRAALQLDREAGRDPRSLWTHAVWTERAVGAALDRSRREPGASQLVPFGPRAAGHALLGFAHTRGRTATDRAHAAIRSGVLGLDWRPDRAQFARRHVGRLSGRVRPHAEDQRRGGPRSLGQCVFVGAGRRWHPRRPRARRVRRDRRRTQVRTRRPRGSSWPPCSTVWAMPQRPNCTIRSDVRCRSLAATWCERY